VNTRGHSPGIRIRSDSVYSVTFSPNGRTLASGGGWPAGTVHLWDSVTGEYKQALAEQAVGFYGRAAAVYSVAFSPDGNTLASGSSDRTIRLWDIITGEHRQILTGHTSAVYSVTFSPDRNILASGSGDDTIRLWAVSTGEHKGTLTGHTDSVYRGTYSQVGVMTKLSACGML
jgi:WD40 repeat protein